ncbi:hypothetical protein [Flavobacterium sp. HBTb2-11-1]|uniref:hypothetical protein n=1 Tax=Flavobacterium sp. HBTb2-11-1 TaxID=2692212 RepID=UPI00136EAB2A|nr:hypothetical protein [Flavobacterium sp. HBTb2-11-1]MXO05616.1 hypothetical protein [Flavobacterium sp. HBTb2-11-1]
MKKLINLIPVFIIIFFNSCNSKNTDNSNTKNLKKEEESVKTSNYYSDADFDNLLKCGDYSFMDGYFTVPDYGCIYQPPTVNILGNVEIYLLPKKKLITESDIEKEEDLIAKMSINNLKMNYDVYILVIDKKYLTHNDKMDVPYFPHFPYKQLIYKWTDGLWKNIATLNIKDKNDSQYKKWKSDFLIVPESSQKQEIGEMRGSYFIKTKVSSIETGDPIEINFYFEFQNSNAILSIGTKNSLEAYCEGSYAVVKDKDGLKLKYTGEGTCTSDEEESSFLIKKENDQYYIKSKRFINEDWQLFKMKS